MKITTTYLRQAKKSGRKLTMLTAYDYAFARLVDDAGVDAILVGDSLGNVILGYKTTIPVTMDDMVHHVRAVSRGVNRALVIGDMPFLSYHVSREESIKNAGRLIQEGGAEAVKLEGGREIAETVRAIVRAGIPVMGHIGLTPQYVHQLGGYRVQGRDEESAVRLLADAEALQEAGVFAIVLECVPAAVAEIITRKLEIPTIGIGAGPHCDGQVLVTHDLLGLFGESGPRFVKRYLQLHDQIMKALRAFIQEVQEGTFPGPEHTYEVDEAVVSRLKSNDQS